MTKELQVIFSRPQAGKTRMPEFIQGFNEEAKLAEAQGKKLQWDSFGEYVQWRVKVEELFDANDKAKHLV